MTKEELIKAYVKKQPSESFIKTHLLKSKIIRGNYVVINDKDKKRLGIVIDSSFSILGNFYTIEIYELCDDAITIYRRRVKKDQVSKISLKEKDLETSNINDCFAETELTGDFLKIWEILN